MRVIYYSFAAFFFSLALLPISLVRAQTVQVVLTDNSLTPPQIQSTKGTEVHLAVRNAGKSVHNLVIPNFHVFTQNLNPGETVDVRFTPDKMGVYPYYSDKKGIREPGIEGTLHVK